MNSLGSNRELAQNKLILLYIIERIAIPASNIQITKIVLENKFMNYFLLQQYLNELCDSNLVSSELIDDKTFYSITPGGRQALGYFINLIPSGIKGRIDNTISSIRKKIKNETLIAADFVPESENEYVVSCRVHEGNFSLIDLKIAVGTKKDARLICDNWQKHSQLIYSEIINSLTKERNKE